LPVRYIATGLKHLHSAAQDFDSGSYFEANGHGTVLFSSKTVKEPPREIKAEITLDLINRTIGDTLGDMLLVKTILNQKS
ncbi:hypothetical protein PPACK8108_LOCUS23032, partial [Phakopsora pachyrhizi]